MLLAIDIGNTNISLGVFKVERLLKRYRIPTNEKTYFKHLKRIFREYKIKDAIACSVVPESTRILDRELTKILGAKPKITGSSVLVPIKNLYRIPRQVGQDRLVNAYAGIILYGTPLVVIDFGTAITFDVISRRGEYLGGMILPGLQISLDALSNRTALLPRVKLAEPKEFIGRDTKNSMISGVVYGFASLANELTLHIKKIIGKKTKIIGTGGDIELINRYCSFNQLDKDLTLKGLNFVYNKKALPF